MKTLDQFLIEQEMTTEFVGIHYSHKPNLTQLTGTSYGTGIKGAERQRINDSTDSRIKNRVYFYPKPSVGLPKPEQGLGSHVYEYRSKDLYNASKRGADTDAIRQRQSEYISKGHDRANAFESAVLDAGYEGYHTDTMAVVLNKNPKVTYLGSSIGKPMSSNSVVQKQQSISDKAPNALGEHESDILSPEQVGHFYKNKSEISSIAPSARLQYGRLVAKTNDLATLKSHFTQHGLSI